MSFITRLRALLPSFTSNTADQNATPNSAQVSTLHDELEENSTPMPDIGTQTRISAGPKENLSLIPAANMSSEMDHQQWNDCWRAIEQYPGWDNPANRQLQAEAAAARAKESTAGSSRGGATPPTPGSGVRAYFGSSPPLPTVSEDVEMRDVDAADGESRYVLEMAETAKAMASEDGAELLPSLGLGESPEYLQTPGGPYSMDEPMFLAAETEVTQPQPPTASRTSAIAKTVAQALQLSAAQRDPTRPSISPLTQFSTNPSPAYGSLAQGTSPKGDPTVSQAAPAKSPTLETLLPGITTQTETPPSQSTVVHPQQAATIFTQPASPGFPYAIQPVASTAQELQSPTAAVKQPQDGSDSESQHLPLGHIGSHIASSLASAQVQAATPAASAPAPIAPSLLPPLQEPPAEILTYAPPQQINIAADPLPERASQPGNRQVINHAAMPVKLPETFRAAVLEEAVAKGATADEQHLIMRSLRSVERSATMADVGRIEGAIEVDASELPEVEDIDGDGDGDVDMTAASELEGEAEPAGATKGKGKRRKRKSEAPKAGTTKKIKAADIPALTNEQHLEAGWEAKPRKYFEAMKLLEVNRYIRTIQSQSRWWNGLNKKNYIDKIMEWQAEMQALQEGGGAEGSSSEEEGGEMMEEEVSVAAASRTSTRASASLRASTAPRTKSKSKTPAAAAPETPTDQVNNTRQASASSISPDRSIFFDPAATPRSTNLLPKLRAVKDNDDENDAVPNGGTGSVQEGDEIRVHTASEARRSRSKTVDSAKHGVRGGKKAGKGQKGKSSEPGETEVSERARSLRRRTASVAPEGYGA